MALSEIDKNLITRCLACKEHAWEDFVDRFMGLVVHVVNHTAQNRSLRLTQDDREDMVSDVFLTLIENDFAVLRHFRGESSLATYLTVIARRVVVRSLIAAPATTQSLEAVDAAQKAPASEERMEDQEEVARLLGSLQGAEAKAVRMYHLEGKNYGEISRAVGMAENSVGPLLSRARTKLRRKATS